jgi:hypothetical protein
MSSDAVVISAPDSIVVCPMGMAARLLSAITDIVESELVMGFREGHTFECNGKVFAPVHNMDEKTRVAVLATVAQIVGAEWVEVIA